MTDEASPGAGDIQIELAGKTMTMVPSAQACMAISRLHGGLNAAVQRCAVMDFDTICAVIQAGLGLNPNQARMVPDAVYTAGTMFLSAACIDFIHVVANGGRPLPADAEDQEPDPLAQKSA